MKVKIIHDSSVVYKFLENKTKYNYIYQLNYLSIDEWKNVICYGLYDNSELKQIAMLIINYEIPVLLAASFENEKYSTELIKRIRKFLPAKFYTHMDRETLENVFLQDSISKLEEYINMGLCDYEEIDKKYEDEAIRLGFKDLDDIKELIMESYPDAWLDDNLVKLNENFGIYDNGKLISFSGIHAYSEEYQVAAVAHVTTHPDYRKRGYGEKVVSALLKSLKNKIRSIGLNVKTNNLAAIRCYKKLGFKEFGRFIACEVENKI